MPSYALVQANSALYRVNPDGTQATIALPPGVTVSSYLPVRGAILNRRLVLVNGVNPNVSLDANLISRLLQPRPPNAALTAALGGVGSLTGTYSWKYTHAIMEGDVVIGESDFSPVSATLALTADEATLTGIGASPDVGVTAQRIYRTASGGGSVFYLVATIANGAGSYTDTITDEALALLPAEESLGSAFGSTAATRLKLIAMWKDRLWAVPDRHPDRVYFSGNRVQYGWNSDYYLVAGGEGTDLVGVTALGPRKNELFVGKRRSLHKITGDGTSDFGLTDIPGTVGVWATESLVVIRDACYFLAEDGVYRWDGRLVNMSGERIHTWLNEKAANDGGVFNLSLFERAFGHWNQKLDTYELYLPSTDSLVFDRWLSLDLQTGEWLGPHRTEAYTPTCAATLDDTTDRQRPAVGASNGGIYLKNSSTYSDAVASAIAMIATTNPMHQGEPDLEKFWGELTLHTQAEAAGTLTVKAKVGNLDAPQGRVAVVSMTRLGSVVTVQTNGEHHFGTGNAIVIANAVETDYNGIWEIVRTSSVFFTFNIGALLPTTPASGAITALLPIRGTIASALQLDRQRNGRLGVGRYCQLSFENNELAQRVEIRGFEIDPVTPLGKR